MTSTKQNRLAEQYLGLAKAQSRLVAKNLKKSGCSVDLDDLESDANLYLTRAIQKFEEKGGECRLTAGYFKQGLNTWAVNYVKNAVKQQQSQGLKFEPLPTSWDSGIEDNTDWQDRVEDLVERVGRHQTQGELLAQVVQRIVQESWSVEEVIGLVGRDRYYRKVRPALIEFLRGSGVEIEK